MFCLNCGKEVSEGIRFCPYCGKTIITVSEENEMEYAGISPAYMKTAVHRENLAIVPIQPVLLNGKCTEDDKKSIKTAVIMMVIGLVGLALYIGISFLIYYVGQEGNSHFNSEQTENIETGGDTNVLHQYDETYYARNMVDMAGVLSVLEEKELSEYMEKIKSFQNCELVAVIIPYDELNGKAIEDDGHGEAYVYTSGNVMSAITDNYIENYFWTDIIVLEKARI